MKQKVIFQLWFMLAAIPFAFPQSGTLVPSFGENGIKLIDFGQIGSSNDYGEIVKTDGDGKILIAGSSSNGDNYDFSIIRLNIDGSIDSTFDGDGKLLIPVGNGDDRAYGLAFGSNGKIMLIGRSELNFSVVQLKSDGALDSSFNDDGKLIIPVNSNHNDYEGLGFIVEREGKILIAGGTMIENQQNFIILRLNPDGSFDNTFASAGKLLVPIHPSHDYLPSSVCAMTFDNNNKILIAGNSFSETGKHQMTIIRTDNKGNLDYTFDGDGKLDLCVGTYTNSLAIGHDGKILIAGVAELGEYANDWKFIIVRLNDDGSFDNTFDNDGIELVTFGGNGDRAYSLLLDGNGNILVAGSFLTESFNQVFSVARLNKDGSLDSTFSDDGKLLIQLRNWEEARSLTLDKNGKLLIAGFSSDSVKNIDFCIVRVNTDGSLDNSFNGTGNQIIPLGNGNDVGKCLALNINGKISVSGSSSDGNNIDFSITRLNSNGSLDKTFNNIGKRILPIGNGSTYSFSDNTNIAQDVYGNVLVAGSVFNGTDNDFGVVRLKYNGLPDSSFDGDGLALLPVGDFDDYVYGIDVDINDKIILFGKSFTDIEYHPDSSKGIIIRLNTDGSPDLTFNETGKLTIPDIIFSKCLKIYPDNNLLMAAFHSDVGSTLNAGDLILYKIRSDGRIESTKDIPTGISLKDVVMDTRGKIFVLGAHGERGIHQHLYSYFPDGSIDSTFGSGGTVQFPQSGLYYTTIQLGVVDSSRIFLAGTNSDGFKLLCLKDDGSIDSTFGLDGRMVQTDGDCSAMALDSNFIWLAGSANGDYKIIKLYARNSQHIDFALPDTIQYGDALVKLVGIASSGLPVTYKSSDPAIAFISHDTLNLTGSGPVTITARQGGDGSYYAADPVIRNMVVKSNVTRIPTREAEAEIKAYPNPVSRILLLDSSDKIKSVLITGIEGSLLFEETNINEHHFKIDMSGYNAGCYFLTIQLDDNQPAQVRKILKL